MGEKIIICKGDVFTPERFWDWTVCTKEEYTDDLKTSGWVISTNSNYLNKEQLIYLGDRPIIEFENL